MKAINIDDKLAEACSALASAKRDYEWDFTGAKRDNRLTALQANPIYDPSAPTRASPPSSRKSGWENSRLIFSGTIISLWKSRQQEIRGA